MNSKVYEAYLKAIIEAHEKEAEENPSKAMQILGRKFSRKHEAKESIDPVEVAPVEIVDASSENGDMDKIDYVASSLEF